jgi:hypothetical protein
MKIPGELPPALGGGPFTVETARSLGIGNERLRRNDLRRPFHGVRAPHVPDEQRAVPGTEAERWAALEFAAQARAREYSVRMPRDQFFSHVTAAIVHGLPLPVGLLTQSTVDVGTSVRARRRSGRGVKGHFVSADVLIVVVNGMRVASVVDTWRQLSTVLSLDQMIIVGDSLVRRQRPPATMAELETAVAQQAGHPGALRMREAFALVRPRTDSPRETLLRLIIVRAGLPEPEVNARLVDRHGRFMAFGDLVYREYKILIEYDGGGHREDEDQFHRDIDRLDLVMEEKWRVIRVNKTHLGPRQGAMLNKVRLALIERGWTPPAAPSAAGAASAPSAVSAVKSSLSPAQTDDLAAPAAGRGGRGGRGRSETDAADA